MFWKVHSTLKPLVRSIIIMQDFRLLISPLLLTRCSLIFVRERESVQVLVNGQMSSGIV